HYHKQFNLNVLGLMLATQKAVSLFGSDGGVVINISSGASISPVAGGAIFCASKAAVDAITKSLARELGPKNIRVNSLNPGVVETEGLHAGGFAEGEFRKRMEASTPLGRIAQPEDISKIAVFLASDDSGWITGEIVL